MSEFRMPSLGADMEAGTLVEWLVEPGKAVKRGDIIAVVETQKGAIEIEVFEDGVFEKSLVEVGEKVPVGTPLALIGHPGEASTEATPTPAPEAPPGIEKPAEAAPPPPEAPAPPAPPSAAPSLAEAPAAKPELAPPPPAVAPAAAGERLRISPAARRLAEQSGIDLSRIAGTGPEGAIVLADVAARIGKVPEAPPAPAGKPSATEGAMSAMRAAIAAAMAHSKREIPHYYLAHTIDLTAAEAFVAAQNAGREPADRLLLGALFVKAVALAAKKYPDFNGHFVEGAYEASPVVHVGVAINIRGTGLVAPAIHNTDTLGLDDVMAGMRDLVARVRAGRFRSSEISDPTITISSLGDRGVETLYGVIYPPQVAIIGFGMPVTRPWAEDGMVGAKRVVHVTLAGDHRVSDGHRGALFLNAIENLLMKPETL